MANFCSACGASVAPLPPPARRLFRSRYHRMIGGVCAGIALQYGWDIALVRIVTALLIVFTAVPAIAYVIAWIVIPQEPLWLPGGMPVTEPRT